MLVFRGLGFTRHFSSVFQSTLLYCPALDSLHALLLCLKKFSGLRSFSFRNLFYGIGGSGVAGCEVGTW